MVATDYSDISGRKQRVVFDGKASKSGLPFLWGNPKEVCLALCCLFRLSWIDLPEAFWNRIPSALHTDYTKLFSSVSSVDNWKKLLQAVFEHANWSHENPCNYHLKSLLLLHETEEKDLGIIVNNNISWDSYIYLIAARANKVLRFRKRATNRGIRVLTWQDVGHWHDCGIDSNLTSNVIGSSATFNLTAYYGSPTPCWIKCGCLDDQFHPARQYDLVNNFNLILLP